MSLPTRRARKARRERDRALSDEGKASRSRRRTYRTLPRTRPAPRPTPHLRRPSPTRPRRHRRHGCTSARPSLPRTSRRGWSPRPPRSRPAAAGRSRPPSRHAPAWRVRPRTSTRRRAEWSASRAKVGPLQLRRGVFWSGVSAAKNPRSENVSLLRLRTQLQVSSNDIGKRLDARAFHSARRTPRHPRFPPRASSRRRGDACEARHRRPQAAGSHVPVLARGHRCRRPEASKADAVRRPAPRVGLHQRGRGEIQAHGRTGQGTSRARLWKAPRVAPVIPIRRPRVARGANAPLAWYGFFEFSQRRSPPPRPATSFSRFGGPFLV